MVCFKNSVAKKKKDCSGYNIFLGRCLNIRKFAKESITQKRS